MGQITDLINMRRSILAKIRHGDNARRPSLYQFPALVRPAPDAQVLTGGLNDLQNHDGPNVCDPSVRQRSVNLVIWCCALYVSTTFNGLGKRGFDGFGASMGTHQYTGRAWADWFSDLALRAIIKSLLVLPYQLRVSLMGWIMRRIIAPLAGYHQRSLANLRFIYPDMSAQRRYEIAQGVADNMGRTFIENYSASVFQARVTQRAATGPGLDAIAAAGATGRAVILVSGHFGNYEAARAALSAQGYQVGGLYRAARNKFFNRHYAKTMRPYGGPVFEQGRKGTSGYVRHLKKGGMMVLLFDQHVSRAKPLPFLGKPAATATSAAQLALRYDAALVPFYGTRRENGFDFDVEFEAPIAHSDAETMTRALHASLEARIAQHPEQWLWIHRRWKVRRKKRRKKRQKNHRSGG